MVDRLKINQAEERHQLRKEVAALKAENERLEIAKREAIAGWKDAERALAERAGGVKVPIGYALVPVEPTDRMVSAYVAAKPKGAGFNHPRKGDDKKAWFAAHEKKCRERWKAMLSVSALTTEPAAPEGRQEAVAWQHIPGCGTDRESKMISVSEGAFCDPCIAPLVAALNTAGIETVASCCGHGHRPGVIALRDGRELFIAKDFDEARKIESIFPADINGSTTRAALEPAAQEGFCYRDENGQVQFQQVAPESQQEAAEADRIRREMEEILRKQSERDIPFAPATRPAEQAVTDEMVEAAISIMFHKHGWFPPRQVVKDALKAAMESGR